MERLCSVLNLQSYMTGTSKRSKSLSDVFIFIKTLEDEMVSCRNLQHFLQSILNDWESHESEDK